MHNELHRMYTSKVELTLKVTDRSWDESTDNVCHRITMCDHLLDFKSRKHSDPKPIQGISYDTFTRHLRTLRRRIEGLMGKSSSWGNPLPVLSSYHWDLLWTGEEALRKYGTTLWETGHKTITLFSGVQGGPIHKVIRESGNGTQTKHTQVPHTKRIPVGVRHTLQSYLNLDWEHWAEVPERTFKTGLPPRNSPSGRRDTTRSQPHLGRWVKGSQISFMNHHIKS